MDLCGKGTTIISVNRWGSSWKTCTTKNVLSNQGLLYFVDTAFFLTDSFLAPRPKPHSPPLPNHATSGSTHLSMTSPKSKGFQKFNKMLNS
jgi:hypothetical protein